MPFSTQPTTRRAFVAGLCALALLPSLGPLRATRARATELEEPGEAETAALAAAQREYDAAQEQLQELGAELEQTQVEISSTEDELEQLDSDIVETRAGIEQTTSELHAAQDALAAFLQISYKSGSTNILDVLLSSSDFNDFVTRSYYVEAVQDSQVETINEIKDLKAQLERQEEVLSQQETEQAELLAHLEEQEAQLSQRRDEANAVVESLSAEVLQLFEAQQAELQAAAQARAQAASAAEGGAALGQNIPGVSQGSVVENAYACLGVPYVWGGDDDNFAEVGGFDCSGFVQHCYALEGYLIGRTTWDQIAEIQNLGNWRTSVEELQPGDLVFPNEGHVGIYIGDGQMIDAPYPGMFIQIDAVTDFIGGGLPV